MLFQHLVGQILCVFVCVWESYYFLSPPLCLLCSSHQRFSILSHSLVSRFPLGCKPEWGKTLITSLIGSVFPLLRGHTLWKTPAGGGRLLNLETPLPFCTGLSMPNIQRLHLEMPNLFLNSRFELLSFCVYINCLNLWMNEIPLNCYLLASFACILSIFGVYDYKRFWSWQSLCVRMRSCAIGVCIGVTCIISIALVLVFMVHRE